MKIVLRIGGSVLGSPPNPSILNGYVKVVSLLIREKHSLGIVVGGGEISRKYINAAKELGLLSYHQDMIAIHASRLNARLVSMKLGGASVVSTSIKSAIARLSKNRIAIMGGLKAGITTDTVATILSEAWRPDVLIKASNQKGIYSSDPRVDKDARFLSSITYSKLKEILGGRHVPGIHRIFDPVAVEHLIRIKVKLIVLDGRDAKNVLRAVHGEKIGTRVF
jgi:uridylate kinase